MKKINDMELEMVAGGITNLNQQWTDCATGENAAPDGKTQQVIRYISDQVLYSE